jgi:hypothetical protein
MKTIILSLTILLISTTSFGWTGKVIGISDGDTIKVLRDGKQVKLGCMELIRQKRHRLLV